MSFGRLVQGFFEFPAQGTNRASVDWSIPIVRPDLSSLEVPRYFENNCVSCVKNSIQCDFIQDRTARERCQEAVEEGGAYPSFPAFGSSVYVPYSPQSFALACKNECPTLVGYPG